MSSKFQYSRTQFQNWLKSLHPRTKVSENNEYIIARFFRTKGHSVSVNSKGQVTVDGVKVTTPAWATKFTIKTHSQRQKTRSAQSALTILADC